ncbi:uncharacterized protein B0P05DRAFT_529292 [Gilbertella persicaria]|uniref:uncharacterized protein n=1 Tax=Gilbertella persicaria TaxID=101096 RepID=UPI00221E6B3B|nr:uncharacterized protein B0P05DRAFT_529292 [Gilbertella persicaria]KAI8090087.1 hypothetical protein B0P05DRAFT_529292 [Gilbertella persicaria]
MLALVKYLLVALVALFALTNAQCSSNLGVCYRTLKGRDFSGWYQECSDKIQKQGVRLGVWKASVGNWNSGGQGCQCTYSSTVPGVWQTVRRSLWDRAIDKKHDCSDALYQNVCPIGQGQVSYTFACR